MTPTLRAVALSGLVAVAGLMIWKFELVRSPLGMANLERPVVTIKARVLDSMDRYIHENQLFDRDTATELNHRARLMGPDHRDDWVDYIVARAADEFDQDPGAVVLEYDHPGCPVILPAGRQFSFKHTGGFIGQIEAIFPLEPMPWDEMQIALADLIAQFDTAGWRRSAGRYTPKVGINENITFDDFLNKSGPKWAQVGFWEQCDTPGIKADIQVRHFNSSSSGSFIPPAQLSDPIDPTAEDTFLFLVTFEAAYESDVDRELVLLRNARRLAVNGDVGAEIPLSVWIEDPDWRPDGWAGVHLK